MSTMGMTEEIAAVQEHLVELLSNAHMAHNLVPDAHDLAICDAFVRQAHEFMFHQVSDDLLRAIVVDLLWPKAFERAVQTIEAIPHPEPTDPPDVDYTKPKKKWWRF